MTRAARTPSDKNPARWAAGTRSFGTTKREVLALADWLRSWQVPAVVMEATGDYWKGPFCRLEAEGSDCVLADARQVRHLPGQPRQDPPDSRWLAACFERGAVSSCFVATPEFRVIRLHTRYRRDLTADRARDKNRAGKLLESAAIKLSSVLSDLRGVTGRDIMDHLIAGERDPRALAQLARAQARRKIPGLRAALEGAGFCTDEHAALLKVMLARIGQASAEITRLTKVIERLLAPWEEQLQQAGSMPGWARRSAEYALAGTGPDMTRFPAGAHLASWAGRTPLDNSSGKRQGTSSQERQPVPGRGHRRDRRPGRPHPDPRRRPLPGPRPGLLRAPARHPPPDQPPRRQARRPRLRSHPLPHPRTRTATARHPNRLTSTAITGKPRAGFAGAAARPAGVLFSGQLSRRLVRTGGGLGGAAGPGQGFRA
jgi:transposase